MTAALRALPAFLPSNMTDEEFLNVIEPCVPHDVFERIKAMAGAQRELDNYQTEDSDRRSELEPSVSTAIDKLATLRERYEVLRELQCCPGGDSPAITEADKLVQSSMDALAEILEEA